MSLVGHMELAGDYYPIVQTSLSKNCTTTIVLTRMPKSDLVLGIERTHVHYRDFAPVLEDYIVGMVTIGNSKAYGNVLIPQRVLSLIAEFKSEAIKDGGVERTISGKVIYSIDGLGTVTDGHNNLIGVDINYKGVLLRLNEVSRINIKKTVINRLQSELISSDRIIESSFHDPSLEYLELKGFSFDWLKEKSYVDIQSMEQINKNLVPHFIRELKAHRVNPTFESFLVTIDFEGTGLDAWDDVVDVVDTTTYCGISFADDTAYGVYTNMRHYDNIEPEQFAKWLTMMFDKDPLVDTEITLVDEDGKDFKFMRSEIKTCSHNMYIDIRFGLRLNAQIWFDYCSMQIGFNADPFFTSGHNGAKDRIAQFVGIEYPELKDIVGMPFIGCFNWISDRRVIRMYGCADVDLLRLYAKQLITGIRESSEYFGADQIESFAKYDEVYMNFKGRFDYKGIRVDKLNAQIKQTEAERILDIYYYHMEKYISRVTVFEHFLQLYDVSVKSGVDPSRLGLPDLDSVDVKPVAKWSGTFLIDTLFETCKYPCLVKTKQNIRSKLEGKVHKAKPAVDKDAVSIYLKIPSVKTLDEIDKAITSPASIEDLHLKSMYLSEDIIDTVNNKVLISKEQFNKNRYPFFLFLQRTGPIEKKVESDYEPITKLTSPYRTSSTSTTKAVTRRDLSPIQTVSKYAKHLYLPYNEDYFIADADQASVEIKIAWGLTGDDKLVELLDDPEVDPHIEVCSEIYNKPAHLIDRETERKRVKFIHFGRLYGREVYSCCGEIFDGDVCPENLAYTARIMELFDLKRKPIIDVLESARNDMWKEREIPTFLFKLFKMNPEKQYGRMINFYHWTQHCEIKELDWYEASMRRKTGNFVVQGVASNILRMLYGRFCLACWSKGWIQNGSVIPHLNVHDEILFSYLKTLDPVEVAITVRDAFVVKIKPFPILYIGMNFGNSWGEAKDDKSEIPALLLEDYKGRWEDGERWDYLKDSVHSSFFKTEIDAYHISRVKEVLLENNLNQTKVWHIESLSDKFINYTVRSYLSGFNAEMFKIKDKSDPVESLCSNLVPFISKHILKDGETSLLVFRNKKFTIEKKDYIGLYEDEEAFIKGNESTINNRILESLDFGDVESDEIEWDLSDSEDDGDDFISPEDEQTSTTQNIVKYSFEDSVSAWDRSYSREYYLPEDIRAKGIGSIDILVKELFGEQEVTENFKHMKRVLKSVIVTVKDNQQAEELIKLTRGKQTTSLDCYELYLKYPRNSKTKLIGKFKYEVMLQVDEFVGVSKTHQ